MRAVKKATVLLLGLAMGAVPLITTASCSPGRGSLDFYRDDHHHDYGVLDVLIGDVYYDDCYYYDCYDDYYYDDYYYDEIIIYD